ncbi:MAG: PadR family transcriptional regulator [Symbiobacteriaceae bacterium]|jgi:DNA-binding PadR family transcriptional regulator|nr:PadR family transcriptional regulator [Symbiobacteriaceae bacterium]
MIKEALLGLLAVQPLHGYDLKVSLDRTLGQTSKFNVGQVYTALGKLEKDGLVEPEFVSRDERSEMKVFHLTAAGRAELNHWFQTPVEKVDLRDELFMKLTLARRAGLADVAGLVRTQRLATLQSIGDLTRLKESYDPVQDLEVILLIEGAILHLEADLQWLDLWVSRSRQG